jgi:hypothetical protein
MYKDPTPPSKKATPGGKRRTSPKPPIPAGASSRRIKPRRPAAASLGEKAYRELPRRPDMPKRDRSKFILPKKGRPRGR